MHNVIAVTRGFSIKTIKEKMFAVSRIIEFLYFIIKKAINADENALVAVYDHRQVNVLKTDSCYI